VTTFSTCSWKLDAAVSHVGEIAYHSVTLRGRATCSAGREDASHYELAIALGLPPNELAGALIVLGSTLRTLDNRKARGNLRRVAAVPDHREFEIFLAPPLLIWASTRAMQLALNALAPSADPGITTYHADSIQVGN